MHSRVYLVFRAFWAFAALALLMLWLRTHDLPHHRYRSLGVAVAFIVAVLCVWRPDGRFATRRAGR